MTSIYTERENILPHHAEWLDRCGAKWEGGQSFSKFYPASLVVFNGKVKNGFTPAISELISDSYTHTPTGTEFCERVAEILGVEKPVFEQFGNSEQVDISKKETTTDHIPYVGQKVDEQDKLFPGRNNTMGEGSLTQEDIEILLGDSIVKPIKGMAIEVSRLSESDKESLSMLQYSFQTSIKQAIKNNLCVGFWSFGSSGFSDKNFYKSAGFTITESPTEFREYVAQQTGKEYKKTADYDVQKFVANREGMAERLAKAPFTNEELMDLPDEEIGKLNFGKPTYPHKTYRILDSLDGIPLDTRIPLSEWIPPMGPKGLVAFISEGWFEKGYLLSIEETRVFIRYGEGKSASFEIKDGHWMRIV